jgi:hypothetical protein
MSNDWLSDLISEYETLEVEQLATSAEITGEVTPAGWELLTTLRNEQIERVLEPDFQRSAGSLFQEELTELGKSVEWYRAAIAEGQSLEDGLFVMESKLAEFNEQRFVSDHLEENVDLRVANLMLISDDRPKSRRVEKRNKIAEDLDLLNASVRFSSLEPAHGSHRRNLEGLIEAGVYQILMRFITECNHAILNVWRQIAAERAPVEPLDAEALSEAFNSTVVHISHSAGELVIPSSSRQRPQWPWKEPVWVVTAHNPGGLLCSIAWNKTANRSLRSALGSLRIECVPATGRAPDGSWEEAGYALIGITKKQAMDVARQYGQLAIFRVHNWRRTVNKTGIKKIEGIPTCEPQYFDDQYDPGNPLCGCGHRAVEHEEEPVPDKHRPIYEEWCETCDGEGCEDCEKEEQDSCQHCSCEEYWEGEFGDEDLNLCYLCEELPIHHPLGDFHLPGFVRCAYYEGPLCGICGKAASGHKASDREEAPDHDFWIAEENFHIDTGSAEEMTKSGLTRKEAMAVIAHRPHGQINLDMTRIRGITRNTLKNLLHGDFV